MSHAEDPLDEALRSLPRQAAGPEFTARVLARLGEPGGMAAGGARRGGPRLALAVSLAAALALVAGLAVRRSARPPAPAAIEQRLQSLRQEWRQIDAALAARRRQPAAPPLLYLGGDERVDLVLDLDELARTTRPASLKGGAAAHPTPTEEP